MLADGGLPGGGGGGPADRCGGAAVGLLGNGRFDGSGPTLLPVLPRPGGGGGAAPRLVGPFDDEYDVLSRLYPLCPAPEVFELLNMGGLLVCGGGGGGAALETWLRLWF